MAGARRQGDGNLGEKTQDRDAAGGSVARTGKPPILRISTPAGQAHMVDVAAKDVTRRIARAGGRIVMRPATLALIRAGTATKGDVLGVARVAAIQAAKRTVGAHPAVSPARRSRASP